MKVQSYTKSTLDVQCSLKEEFKNDNSKKAILVSAFAAGNKSIAQLKKELGVNYIIIYNFEPYTSKFFKADEYKNYTTLIKTCDEFWDYDEENLKYLSHLNKNSKHHILKSFITIPEQPKEYDVLFYGLKFERRKKILDELAADGIKVCDAFGVYGDDLNDYIAKSKCLLNIHSRDIARQQEQARLVRWIGNGKIFSEKSLKNYLHIDEYEYDELTDSIKNYLTTL
jgi:hypothetical protein